MSFLQSWILWTLPLIGLPILIHLIHKRRHRVVAWGAMMFLLQGAQMSRGLQKLRHVLLLLVRTLAVAGLVFAIGRPIAGGWLGGLGGGRPDMVLVLLDRSGSMRELVPGTGDSKLELALERLTEALENVQASRWACIDSVTGDVTALSSPRDLADLPITTATDARADVPGLFERAAEHLRVNGAGRSEIWVASDAQSADWSPEDGRWPALQDALLALPAGVRVNVLSFSERAPDDLGVRVLDVKRVRSGEGVELALDLDVVARTPREEPRTVPVGVVLDGARSVVQVELSGERAELRGHRIPLETAEGQGWGVVQLPGDASPSDNAHYFTFGESELLETVIVADDTGVAEVLRYAAEAPVDEGVQYLARVVPVEDATQLDLAGASLLLWQAALPEDEQALVVEDFLTSGGVVLFLPPDEGDDGSFRGTTWGAEREVGTDAEPFSPTTWRTTGELLRDGADGTRLAVDRVEVRKLRPIQGDVTPLAGFEDGTALLARAPTSRGALYFLATTTKAADSNLANQGVTLVAVVHRALEQAAEAVSARARREAGRFDASTGGFSLVSEVDPEWLLSEHAFHAGVLSDGERFVALNRSEAEDRSAALADEALLALLPEVDVSIQSGAEDRGGLIEEIWRVFLYLLLFMLIAEALLCITESVHVPSEAAPAPAFVEEAA